MIICSSSSYEKIKIHSIDKRVKINTSSEIVYNHTSLITKFGQKFPFHSSCFGITPTGKARPGIVVRCCNQSSVIMTV